MWFFERDRVNTSGRWGSSFRARNLGTQTTDMRAWELHGNVVSEATGDVVIDWEVLFLLQ